MGSYSLACKTHGLFLPRRHLLGYPHYIFYYWCLWAQDKKPVRVVHILIFNLLTAYCDLGKLADHLGFHANSSYCLCMQREQGDHKSRMSSPSRCSLLCSIQSTKLLQYVISGDVRGLSNFKYVLLCWAFCAAVEGHAIYDPKGFWNSVEQKEELLLHQFRVTVSSFCICIFNFCSSGSGWKKNMGKTLLRICKRPKIFWANTKSRQSCIRLLEEGSGITTSHQCHHSHTATTQQRPNHKRSISFFLSTFAKHLAMFSIPCSGLSAVNHAKLLIYRKLLDDIMCVCMSVFHTVL